MGMFDNIFEHCHMDNSVFVYGMFWSIFLVITYIGTIYYRYQESWEAEEAKLNAERDAALAA